MKIYILCGIFIYMAQVHAETLTTINFTANIKNSITDKDSFRNSLDCYLMKRGDETNSQPNENIMSNKIWQQISGDKVLSLEPTSEHIKINIGKVELNLTQQNENNSGGDTFDLAIKNNLTSSFQNVIKHTTNNCVETTSYGRIAHSVFS